MFGCIVNVRIVNAWLTVSTRGSVTFSRRSRRPFKKFRILAIAMTKGAIKVPVRVGRLPNEQPESPQVCYLKTRVHHLTQGVSYNDVGRWPRFGTQQGGATCAKLECRVGDVPCGYGKLFLCLHNKKQGFGAYHQNVQAIPQCFCFCEFDLRLIQWFWWPLCYCALIPNIS